MKLILIPAVCIAILITQVELRADDIYLKSGRIVKGTISEETDEEVSVRVDYGSFKLYKNQIDRIEKTSPQELPAAEPGRTENYTSQSDADTSVLADRLIYGGQLTPQGETKHFIFFSKDPQYTARLLEASENILNEISAFLGVSPDSVWSGKCAIIVALKTDRRPSRTWERYFSEWVAGAARPRAGEIYLYYYTESPLETLLVVFRHELAHIVLNAMVGGKKLPLWVHEGYACYEMFKVPQARAYVDLRAIL
ncbi:MAG: hypothetical protein ABIH01_00375, partial [Candidatus Omnitrophota bacterium]